MKITKEKIDIFKGNTLDINIPKDLKLTSVKIGNQIWMRRNLNVTKFRNGDPIHEATNIYELKEDHPLCCSFEFFPENARKYGRLYNRAAITDERGLAPAGWRIPKISDWLKLSEFLGEHCGGKLKQKGTSSWNSPNTGATNETHFTALPGGSYSFNDGFVGKGFSGVWTCIDLYESGDWEPLNYVIQARLHYNNDILDIPFDGQYEKFCSVRCIRSDREMPSK